MVAEHESAVRFLRKMREATDGFGADLAAGEQVFWLKYLLSSQSAILWMSLLFYMSTLFYWGGFFTGAGRNSVAEVAGSKLAWGGVLMALIGTFVRWYESHQALGALEDDLGPADLELIARVDLALVDTSAVDEGARLVTEIDQSDVFGRRHLDDGVHARGELIIDAKVALGILAHLHDVL